MQWHPDKASADNKATAEAKFQAIAEAYDVLSDPANRAVYDQFGYEGLKDGVPDEKGNASGYQYGNNGGDIFTKFFGTENPFADFGFNEATPFTSKLKKQGPKKGEAVVKDLECTLGELFNGCVKKLKVTRLRYTGEGDLVEESKVLSVTVKPGWKKGTKITFPCEGDEGPDVVPADVVFVITEAPHASLAREASSLVFLATISLADALTDCVITVPTLDGRTLSLPCPEVVYPGYEKRVAGEGMPQSKKAGERGDLVIRFKILFPDFLDEKRKGEIRKSLAGTERGRTDVEQPAAEEPAAAAAAAE
jgi:DnaJ-class molecular chaperone